MKLNIRTLCASVAVLAAILMTSGCLGEPEIPVINGPYIQSYYDGALTGQIYYTEDNGPIIYFETIGTEDEPIVSYSSASTGEKKAVYDSLCNKHSDYGYHGEDPYANEPVKKCYAKDVISFDVVSDSDFDKDHPAGTSLKDILVYDSFTPYRWIKGGYQGQPTFQHVKVLASEVQPDDMKLLPAIQLFALKFFDFPLGNSHHNLTVTVVTDDGVSHEFDLEVYF